MKILVTGAGYIGSYLTKLLLDSGYQVRLVDNFYKGHCDSIIPYCSNENFEFNFGDITSTTDCIKMIAGVDAIIHTCALVGAPICSKYPALSRLVNVEGTKNLINEKPPSIPLFFMSTGSVYGSLDKICTEESPTNPQSNYARDKLTAEKCILDYENTYIYRFSTAFGVSPSMRVNLLINDLVFQAITNKSLVIFQADFIRTFIHIFDFCQSIIFGLENYKNFKHRLYNIGHPDNNWTKREVVELIKKKTGCALFFENIMEDPDQRNYDTSFQKILNEGWKPRTKIEEGIDELIKAVPLIQVNRNYK